MTASREHVHDADALFSTNLVRAHREGRSPLFTENREGFLLGNLASARNCLKSPNRLQIDALRVDNTGQKHHFLLVTAPKLPLRLCSQLLFRQFLNTILKSLMSGPIVSPSA